jgi:hypothetical protein
MQYVGQFVRERRLTRGGTAVDPNAHRMRPIDSQHGIGQHGQNLGTPAHHVSLEFCSGIRGRALPSVVARWR